MYLNKHIKFGKKLIYLTFAILFALSFNIYYVSANQISENATISKDGSKVSEEMFSAISMLVKDITSYNVKIENRIDELRKSEAYTNYPAVRLNVDTPVFGISDYVKRKLKVNYDISASDITQGYCLSDIISKNTIKIPSFTIGSFVVLTKEVKIDNEMSSTDATDTLFQLLKYREQIKAVSQNLDGQINNILFEYIGSDKINNINDINGRLDKVISNNTVTNEYLNQLEVLQYDNNLKKINDVDYIRYTEKQAEIISKVKLYKEELGILPISDSKINEIKNKTYELIIESDIFNDEIEKVYNLQVQSIDVKGLISSLSDKMKTEIEFVQEYIDNGVLQSEDKNNYDKSVNENDVFGISFNFPVISNVSYLQYNTTSKSSVINLQNIQKKVDGYLESNTGVSVYSSATNSNDNTVQTGTKLQEENLFTDDEKIKILKDLTGLYKDFKTIEINYLNDNNSLLLSDSKTKVKLIGKNTLENVTSYVYKAYIDFQENYDYLLKNINFKNLSNIDYSFEKLKVLNLNILKDNILINKIYNEKLINFTENTSRD